jgi:hypothetical protein
MMDLHAAQIQIELEGANLTLDAVVMIMTGTYAIQDGGGER